MLKFGNPEFSRFLHDKGFKIEGKKYKLFSFALRFEKAIARKEGIELQSSAAYLYVASPLIDSFINGFIIGALGGVSIDLKIDDLDYKFIIETAESLKPPDYSEIMSFTLLSPLVISTKRSEDNSVPPYYFRYDDPIEEINRIVSNNLANKYKLIHGEYPAGGNIEIEWDKKYIARALKANRKLSRKITIKTSESEIDIVGIEAPFTAIGAPDLIRTGYECGFGEKNSMGFGMVESAEKRH